MSLEPMIAVRAQGRPRRRGRCRPDVGVRGRRAPALRGGPPGVTRVHVTWATFHVKHPPRPTRGAEGVRVRPAAAGRAVRRAAGRPRVSVRGLIGPREAPRLWDRHLLNCGRAGDADPGGRLGVRHRDRRRTARAGAGHRPARTSRSRWSSRCCDVRRSSTRSCAELGLEPRRRWSAGGPRTCTGARRSTSSRPVPSPPGAAARVVDAAGGAHRRAGGDEGPLGRRGDRGAARTSCALAVRRARRCSRWAPGRRSAHHRGPGAVGRPAPDRLAALPGVPSGAPGVRTRSCGRARGELS